MSYKKRRRLLAFWEEDRCCRYCGKETFLVFRPISSSEDLLPTHPQEATIEHPNSKLSGNRSRDDQTILACNACNKQKDQEDHEKVGIEEIHKRSGRSKVKKYEKLKTGAKTAVRFVFKAYRKFLQRYKSVLNEYRKNPDAGQSVITEGTRQVGECEDRIRTLEDAREDLDDSMESLEQFTKGLGSQELYGDIDMSVKP